MKKKTRRNLALAGGVTLALAMVAGMSLSHSFSPVNAEAGKFSNL